MLKCINMLVSIYSGIQYNVWIGAVKNNKYLNTKNGAINSFLIYINVQYTHNKFDVLAQIQRINCTILFQLVKMECLPKASWATCFDVFNLRNRYLVSDPRAAVIGMNLPRKEWTFLNSKCVQDFDRCYF